MAKLHEVLRDLVPNHYFSTNFCKMKQFKYLLPLTLLFLAIFASCGDDDFNVEDDTMVDESSTLYESSSFSKACDDGTSQELNLITVTDRGEGTGSTTWTKDNNYILNGLVFVNPGQTLIIEAGTVIKGKSGQGENAAALIVARGGTILAEGTATDPIIFTSESDQLFRDPMGNLCSEGGQSSSVNGLWGGLIVLGNAGLNSAPGETAIDGVPTTEPRGLFGGSNDADNSGVLKYVSIRHGGTDIGAGNEINGLTLGGVGSSTVIEYIEVFANADDGIEFFGGTARVKYLAVSYCGDDGTDYDEGFRGKGQFWLVVQDETGDSGGEHDGGTDPETAQPYATPTIFNATYLGDSPDQKRAVRIRDNAGGYYYNSIFSSYLRGVHIELLDDEQDSFKQLQDGNLVFNNNVFHNIGGDVFSIEDQTSNGTGVDAANAEAMNIFNENDNTVLGESELSFTQQVIPAENAVLEGGAAPTDAFFEQVDYKGAVEPGTTNSWIMGWTRLSRELN